MAFVSVLHQLLAWAGMPQGTQDTELILEDASSEAMLEAMLEGLQPEDASPFVMHADDAAQWEQELIKVPGDIQSVAVQGDLERLPDSISRLTELRCLHLGPPCPQLRSLPSTLSFLTHLTELRLDYCFQLGIHDHWAPQLPLLSRLVWSGQPHRLPPYLFTLTNVAQLVLEVNGELDHLPEGITQLTNLRSFDFRSAFQREFPVIPTSLSCLERLSMPKCWSLHSLPPTVCVLKNLRHLDCGGCKSLQVLPEGLSQLSNLHTLDLSSCEALRSLPEGLGQLTNLHILDLSECGSVQRLPEGLGQLVRLDTLNLEGCRSLQSLPKELGHFTNLRTLNLKDCRSLVSFPEELGQLKLCTLNLSCCDSLESLPTGLGKLYELTTLDLSACSTLKSLPKKLGDLFGLRTINLQLCSSLQSLPKELDNIWHLSSLDLAGCEKLTSIPIFRGWPTGLPNIDIRGCERLPYELLVKVPAKTPGLAHALSCARHGRAAFVLGLEQTLEQAMTAVSWIAILMATASFLGFVSVPGGSQPGGVVRVGEAAPPQPAPALNQAALRVYFAADAVTFLVAFATAIFAVAQNMPRVTPPSGRGMLTEIVVSCTLLLITAVSGVIIFLSGAFAVYPYDRSTGALIAACCVSGAFVVAASGYLLWRLWDVATALQWWAPDVVNEPTDNNSQMQTDSETQTGVLKNILEALQGKPGDKKSELHTDVLSGILNELREIKVQGQRSRNDIGPEPSPSVGQSVPPDEPRHGGLSNSATEANQLHTASPSSSSSSRHRSRIRTNPDGEGHLGGSLDAATSEGATVDGVQRVHQGLLEIQGEGSPKEDGGAHSGSVRQIAAAHEQRGESINGTGPTEGSHQHTARLDSTRDGPVPSGQPIRSGSAQDERTPLLHPDISPV